MSDTGRASTGTEDARERARIAMAAFYARPQDGDDERAELATWWDKSSSSQKEKWLAVADALAAARPVEDADVELAAAALWAKATEQEIKRAGTDFNVAHKHYEDAPEWRKVFCREQTQAVIDALAGRPVTGTKEER